MPPNMDRPLGGQVKSETSLRALIGRVAILALGFAVLAFALSRIDLTHDLSRLRASVLSGEPGGNYHLVVARMGEIAAQSRGVVNEVSSKGSVESVRRLLAASTTCEVQFALVQDGTDWGQDSGGGKATGHLWVYGRLARREAVMFLGKNADRLHDFGELRGMRLGIGPAGSGTEQIAQELLRLPDFAGLGVQPSRHPLDEQLALLGSGALDLGVFVMQDDAPIVADAVRERGMELAGFSHTSAVAHRLPHLRTGHIDAGIYDAVRGLPPTDKEVMRVETLVVGNGCAGRVAASDLLTVLGRQFPDFIRYNKDTPNLTSLPTHPVAEEFFDNGGPQLADLYVPWLVGVMPPANWAYVVMGISVLFNAMGAGHRFRLWRIDASRVRLEQRLLGIFGPGVTLGDIQRTAPSSDARYAQQGTREAVLALVDEFERLAARSRRYSLSMLVPMGQEMAYRYQEGVIYESIAVLRDFANRAAAP